MYEISLEIVKILEKGECPRGHKVGEKFRYPDDIGKICQSAYNSFFPYITALRFDGSFPWSQDKDTTMLCCPDPDNPVVFKITRTKSDTEE
ncbi:MAG: TIGR04076 family protein [Candidatus Hodarchaeota archaeon]